MAGLGLQGSRLPGSPTHISVAHFYSALLFSSPRIAWLLSFTAEMVNNYKFQMWGLITPTSTDAQSVTPVNVQKAVSCGILLPMPVL